MVAEVGGFGLRDPSDAARRVLRKHLVEAWECVGVVGDDDQAPARFRTAAVAR
jgi:hypothetical protein